MSDEALHRRFFGARRNFSEKEAEYFLDIDFMNHVALVAVVQENGKQAIVGAGRYVVIQRGQAELAFGVVDQYQGQGLGVALILLAGSRCFYLCKQGGTWAVFDFCGTITNKYLALLFTQTLLYPLLCNWTEKCPLDPKRNRSSGTTFRSTYSTPTPAIKTGRRSANYRGR
jgi:hypothetical protein